MEAQKNTNTNAASAGYMSSASSSETTSKKMWVKYPDNSTMEVDKVRLEETIAFVAQGYEQDISLKLLLEEAEKTMFDGITPSEIDDALLLAAVSFIERDPAYNKVAGRLLVKKLFKEVTGISMRTHYSLELYKKAFIDAIEKGVAEKLLDPRVLEFDLPTLAAALVPERDAYFGYMGLRTLYERYFIKIEDAQRLELPQIFWMRVAMGVSLLEPNKTARAIEFYNLISTMRYVPGTPTLLHSALTCPQLSSCYLTTIQDDLKHIFKCLGDNAQLSKWSGGVANDWTNIRGTGAWIKTIKTESQGLIPYLKIASDVTASINRSGKRRAATVVYLEVWHIDFEDFLDLRRNTGDERRRTHDINTACWVPDLFMKRVIENGNWTFFSPEETPELHSIYGKAFEEKYIEYEKKAAQGKIKLFKTIEATALWRKMLSRLFETGHPWITFKDPCNIRSPQDHVGVVHSSNLCTEITLNTSSAETAVCNLGSVNLTEHIINGQLDKTLLAQTVHTAIRMLDNVIDINFYPTIEAQTANMRHRPVGLGLMGFQDALYKLNINFADAGARDFADESMEFIAYHAILASSELAKERGTYESYKGSKWDRNIFPQDTIDLLEQERGMPINLKRTGVLDWSSVRDHVKIYGMRNSNTMAIAPTATISNIAGCIPCIEPIYKNLYVKANMTGEFTVVNTYLVEDLKQLGLWDHDMLELLKYYDGSVQFVERIPAHLKTKYKEVFEIDAEWLVDISAARGKWIDQSQSHNIFLKGVSGKKLDEVYRRAWHSGLKTTYYLRTLGASQIEKSTLDAKKFGYTQKREYTPGVDGSSAANASAAAPVNEASPITQSFFAQQVASAPFVAQSVPDEEPVARACSLSDDPECESCQ